MRAWPVISGVAVVLLAIAIPLFMMVNVASAWEATRQSGAVWHQLPAILSGNLQGQAEARQDISKGKLCVLVWGLGAGYSASTSMLKERFGIELRVVAGCVVTSEEMSRWNAYNDVMSAEIDRRFGKGKIEEAVREMESRP